MALSVGRLKGDYVQQLGVAVMRILDECVAIKGRIESGMMIFEIKLEWHRL
jgi:hypothetical protein